MSFSTTVTESITFTITHARHIGAKVAADLKRVQRLYEGKPSDALIAEFEAELIALLKAGYLGTVTYGYRRNGAWIEPTVRYTAKDLAGGYADDDDPGRIRPNADIAGAHFYSYLTHNSAWRALTAAEQAAFDATLPFSRSGAAEPSVSGYLTTDRTYSAGGRAMIRASVRSY